ncbi:MAG: MBL fold metallo-hydrolase [Xanthomonadales bacterium]|nr:MBL fold metallo-hydrolase [Xanthomonadales bacterium]
MQSSARIGGKLVILALFAGIMAPEVLPADVTVTQLANEGVILSDGGKNQVMIDGMVTEPYSLYGGLPENVVALYSRASGPFAEIEVALVSHQHHDHNQPAASCQLMQKSTGTLLVSSQQVVDLMHEKCRQLAVAGARIKVIDPQYGQPEVMQLGDIKITAFRLSHGGGKYAVLQNFGFLVEIGGMRVLHVGDADMNAADFIRAGVHSMGIDIALLPFWYFAPGPGGELVSTYIDVPHKIANHIPPGEMAETKEYMQGAYPDVLILENPMDQVSFSPAVSPTP